MERGTLWIRKDIMVTNRGNAVPYSSGCSVSMYLKMLSLLVLRGARRLRGYVDVWKKKKNTENKTKRAARPVCALTCIVFHVVDGTRTYTISSILSTFFFFGFVGAAINARVEAASPQRGGPLHDYKLPSRERLQAPRLPYRTKQHKKPWSYLGLT